ncbi:MAG TPA: serine/threonine-protein kinase [Labilithrix sp.]|nr:serine/threonine-protein kinase [Labilithrix sp.]
MSTQVLAERFRLDERIGRGAMGDVWAATDLQTGEPVAVKLARGLAATDEALRERFSLEGKVLRRIRSPHVCALVDAGHAADGALYMVLERLHGETLEALLERVGFLPLEEVGRIADEVLQALIVAHAAGVVHRDLSPANIFLHTARDGTAVTKVVDFGVAKADDLLASVTLPGTTLGSLPFVAPEQLGDASRAGSRADLYALGSIVFRALSGQMPYGEARGTALMTLKREHDPPTIDEATGETWPAALRAFLVKSMARTPSKRYGSAEIARAALREAVRGRGPRLAVPEGARGVGRTLTLDESPAGRPRGER